MPRALVVADDLTGAIDIAHAFVARGYRTTVQVDPGRAPSDSTALALNTDFAIRRSRDGRGTGPQSGRIDRRSGRLQEGRLDAPGERRERGARIESTMEPDGLLVSEPVARDLEGRADVEVGELRSLALKDGTLPPLD